MSEPVVFAGHDLPDAGQIPDAGWGTVYRTPMFRPPGTPRALPLSAAHKVTFRDGLPTVTPSIHYDPGGPWEWHGWLTDGAWFGEQRRPSDTHVEAPVSGSSQQVQP